MEQYYVATDLVQAVVSNRKMKWKAVYLNRNEYRFTMNATYTSTLCEDVTYKIELYRLFDDVVLEIDGCQIDFNKNDWDYTDNIKALRDLYDSLEKNLDNRMEKFVAHIIV